MREPAAGRGGAFWRPGPVTFENTKFEDWSLERAAYDLVYAAQSFHWVDQDSGYAKAGEASRGGGALALFWNRPRTTPSPLQAQLARRRLD